MKLDPIGKLKRHLWHFKDRRKHKHALEKINGDINGEEMREEMENNSSKRLLVTLNMRYKNIKQIINV